MTAVIETVNLTKHYPKIKGYKDLVLHPFKKQYTTALDGVNLSIENGCFFGLLGPNGAGKTTLIKILSTLVLPTAGNASVNGFDVVQQHRQVRQSIGLVVNDERSFYWRLTARQNLSFFATLNNLSSPVRERRIEEVLQITELDRDANRRFSDYSTGMKQRLAIARGLLSDPTIIFLDEPTRSLDPLSARHLRKFIKEDIVCKHNRTALLATHNLYEAEDFCTHIAIINNGTIKACGPIDTIKAQIKSDRSYILRLGKKSRFTDLCSLNSAVRILPVSDEALTFYIESTDIARVIGDIISRGGAVEECTLKTISLDDVFSRVIEDTTDQ
jgi:ABC-2 type transport system ATP-binding protein